MKYKCDHCDNEFTDSGQRNEHIKSVHEQKKYPCSLCDYQATQQGHLTIHKNQFMKVSSIHVQYVDIMQPARMIFINIFSQNIKEKNIIVILVIRNIQVHQVSGFIINQFMKV